jgi:HK97 family phage major capsid protein
MYFAVKAEYHSKGTLFMIDKTALVIGKLKDDNGNYLWNPNSDTILGKPVVISEFMPCAGSGKKPVAFDDFSYYWVIDRRPVTMVPIVERFAINDQIGYIAYEFLDGKLVRQQAIKVLRVK